MYRVNQHLGRSKGDRHHFTRQPGYKFTTANITKWQLHSRLCRTKISMLDAEIKLVRPRATFPADEDDRRETSAYNGDSVHLTRLHRAPIRAPESDETRCKCKETPSEMTKAIPKALREATAVVSRRRFLSWSGARKTSNFSFRDQ